MIRFIFAIPVLATGDALRVGSEIAQHIGFAIAGRSHLNNRRKS